MIDYKENIIDIINQKYNIINKKFNNKTSIVYLLEYLNMTSKPEWVIEIRTLRVSQNNRIVYYLLGTKYDKNSNIEEQFNFGTLFNLDKNKKGELPLYIEDISNSNNIFEKINNFLN